MRSWPTSTAGWRTAIPATDHSLATTG
jgi:hypothetical protein